MRIDSFTRNQVSKSAYDLDIEQVRDEERIVMDGQIAPECIRKRAVYQQFDNDRGIQNNHRASRNSRSTCAALRLVGIGLVCRVRSSHSRIVGRSTLRSNSRLMKSDRLMPSRAALAFKMLCTWSGTSLTWIIFDMFLAYKRVLHMSMRRQPTRQFTRG